MSKLADLLARVTRGPQSSIGFAARSVEKVPPLLLLAAGPVEALQVDEVAHLDAFLAAGVGPVLAPSAEGLLWGTQGDNLGPDAIREAGADFVAFVPAETPASLLNNEALGKILIVADENAPDSLLRASDSFPIDATLIDLSGGVLTVERLASVYRIAALIRRPVIVGIEPTWGQEELVALRDAGALGILLRVPAPEGAFARLHGAIEALPPRKRPRARGEALLPSLQEIPPAAPARPPEIEEPDEDDDDF